MHAKIHKTEKRKTVTKCLKKKNNRRTTEIKTDQLANPIISTKSITNDRTKNALNNQNKSMCGTVKNLMSGRLFPV
ncbi:hypothetical protein MsAc7_13850 [Methanolapillus millepedarum]|uniref:Uncharacterized protein n=1 Tax=Methanolapillus millepedarum TaxID=3028296 RepID=A0AA97A4H3_9EURY|nr:hypothetical protein MsAc7_13850 [Methanosarcinaceae archaeon Ac7]